MQFIRYASLWFELLAYAVTFGYYLPYWYISRAKSLNGIRSSSKIPVIFAVIYAVLCVAAFRNVLYIRPDVPSA